MQSSDAPLLVAVFDYRRHFIFLAVAIVVLAAFSQLPLYENLVVASAVSGLLHAATLIASLRAAATVMRKLLFAVIAAALTVMSMYLGIIAFVALAALPEVEHQLAVVGIAAVTGAITYGSLVRIFWIRAIKPRKILGLAALCAGATMTGYILKLKFNWPGTWWLAVIWWLAFSTALTLISVPPQPKSP
jgi:hypothetical protein